MPSRNTVREYDIPAYYHIYNRGAGGQYIFHDASDKRKFLTLLERYTSDDDAHRQYPTYDIDLIAFCIMGNHFHLLVFQENDPLAITALMRSVSTAYSMYFNKKYKAHGHVFQSVFKSSKIDNESYLTHITRYIHLNPETYLTYKYSSLPYFLGRKSATWVHPQKITDTQPEQYLNFLEDYRDRRTLLKEIRKELAI